MDQPSSSSKTIAVAALQPELRWGDPQGNMKMIRSAVRQLRDFGPMDLAVLPEVFCGISPESDRAPATEQARTFLRNLARDFAIGVVGGSVAMRVDDRTYNTCLVFDSRGEQVGQYSKRKLFNRELHRLHPGEHDGVFELAGARIGVLICADLWHPELTRTLCGKIDVLCVPAKSVVPSRQFLAYARHIWLNLALTRAMENVFAVAVADWPRATHQTGQTREGVPIHLTHFTAGGTSICDPSRRPDLDRLQSSVPDGHAGALVTEIDLARLHEYAAYRRRVGLLP